jgi:multicomponent Na+:H+ antiporter subunit B
VTSLILQTTTRLLLPILLLYSLFLFFRGHNYAGGGFIGGLVAGGAFALYALAHDARSLKDLLEINPQTLLTWGLFFAVGAGLLPVILGYPFLTGEWFRFEIPRLGEVHIGTPLFFDLGVYLVVIGSTLTILINLMEE